MKHFLPRVNIGIKIFGIATSMLAFLVAVVYIGHDRIRKVNNELVDIAEYLTPLIEHTATVNVHALEQDIHLERIFQLYAIEPLDQQRLQRELRAFEERGVLVDQEIEEAITLAEEGVKRATLTRNIVKFARFQPFFEILEQNHQKFHDQGIEIIDLLEQGKRSEAYILEAELDEEEDIFNSRIEQILTELENHTEHAALVAARHEQEVVRLNWILTGAATLVGIVYAFFLSYGVVNPIKRLLNGTKAVEKGNLDVQVAIHSRDELETLAKVFNQMVDGVREKERIKSTFGQYIDPRIVDGLIQQHSNTEQQGEKQMMTVFFSDVAGFSSISELLTPEGLVNLINQYLNLAAEPITRYQGVIDQFIGDAVKAFWGVPFVQPEEHAKLACYAALEQFVQLGKLERMMPELMGFRKGLPKIDIRIGLATSELVAGNIGSEEFQSYTVMGEAVQVAEELESLNKVYGTHILMLENTKELAGDTFASREIDIVYLPGQQKPVAIYELLGKQGLLNPILAQLRDIFEQGLVAYRQQKWEIAKAKFNQCLALKTDDRPAKLHLHRIAQIQHKHLPLDWNGVFF